MVATHESYSRKILDDWIRQAEQSKITQLQKMAVTMKIYYCCPVKIN